MINEALIGILRPHGRPRRALPRQQQPDGQRIAFFHALKTACVSARNIFDRHESQILSSHDPALVKRAAHEALDSFPADMLLEISRRHGRRVEEFQRQQFARQIQAAFGLPLAAIERYLPSRVDEWAAGCVELARAAVGRYFDRLAEDVEDQTIVRPETLARDFELDYSILENETARVARDQVGKLFGQANADRQIAQGIDGFVWRTMFDERVRHEHSKLEGKRCSWQDPPRNAAGEPIIPGSEINCRCSAEPIL